MELVNLDADRISRICYPLIGILGITGNLLIVVVMVTSKHLLKSVTNVLIVNQSALDFTASIMIILSTFFRGIDSESSTLSKEIFCRVWQTNMFVWGIFMSSTYNLVVITLERYLTIVYPFKFSHRITTKKAGVVIAVVWIFGPIYNALFMIPTAGLNEQGYCSVYSFWPNEVTQRAVGILTVGLQFFVPIILIAIAYVQISFVLKKSVEGAHSIREEKITRARRNVIKTLLIVTVCFVLCWCPNQAYFLLFNLGYEHVDFNSTFYHFTVIAVFCNCCMNPFIYSIQFEQFQKAAKKLFICQKGALRWEIDQRFGCCCGPDENTNTKTVFYLPKHITDSTAMSTSIGSDVIRV
ncbi:hypothetical protein CAPTEDRAFT_107711 [Capitella teleta]|uniref:G-protein coupled receptors family 1 profile domain-containing protein n=1 Tax=Capitella teleta TaxID=283909 RepID=R7UQD0_CAPTE|nr:hypothetical protein CAPTEDRAFT_107711 [Capitella teleta]|eukprot:ELU05601.1 hypothetical protein CAPTEDRAFT_107711 [Capitella teleta]